MPHIILRDTNGPSDADGRELARAWVPEKSVRAVQALVDRAIEWGHDLSYIEVEPDKPIREVLPQFEDEPAS